MNNDIAKIVNVLKDSINKFMNERNLDNSQKASVVLTLKDLLTINVTSNNEKAKVVYDAMNETVLWRAQSMFSKEPETIEWIDCFDEGDVFWDIGANVGVFTLYAGILGYKTLAFEPSSANYYSLNKNIMINKIDSHASAFCIAFSEDESLGSMELRGLNIGGALHSFSKENQEGYFHHGAFSISIDRFIEIFKPSFPNQLKIDVDGLEALIIKGAKKTLSDPRLKSILIEIDRSNEDELESIQNIILEAGFVLKKYTHAPAFDNTVHKDVYNHIFVREV